MARILRPSLWKDDYWFQPELPTPVRLRGLRFPGNVDRMRVHRHFLRFNYVSWILFLAFFYITRYLLIWYISTGFFSTTEGVPMMLLPFHLTAEQIAQVRAGVPLKDEDGVVIIDPSRDSLHVVEMTESGELLCGDGTTDVANYVENICMSKTDRRKFLAIVPHGEADYQDVVDALDAARVRGDPQCPLSVIVASPAGQLPRQNV